MKTSITTRTSSQKTKSKKHVKVSTSKKVYCIQLTYTGIVVLDIQQISTTTAVIAAPSIFAATFRALTSFVLFAFINVCQDTEVVQLMQSNFFSSGKHSLGIIKFTMLVQPMD